MIFYEEEVCPIQSLQTMVYALFIVNIWGHALPRVVLWLCPDKALYTSFIHNMLPFATVHSPFDPDQISLVTVVS